MRPITLSGFFSESHYFHGELTSVHESRAQHFGKGSPLCFFCTERGLCRLLDDLVQYMDEPVRQSLWNQMDVEKNAHVPRARACVFTWLLSGLNVPSA